MDMKYLYELSESSLHFSLKLDDREMLQKIVIASMLASFNANHNRVFVIVCSQIEKNQFSDLLESSGKIVRHQRSNGSFWLKNAREPNGMPTVIFRHARAGDEECLAGFCFQNARFFVDSDYVSQKALEVLYAGCGEQDNALTLYGKAGSAFEGVSFSLSAKPF